MPLVLRNGELVRVGRSRGCGVRSGPRRKVLRGDGPSGGLVLYNGGLLMVDGALASSTNCCCFQTPAEPCPCCNVGTTRKFVDVTLAGFVDQTFGSCGNCQVLNETYEDIPQSLFGPCSYCEPEPTILPGCPDVPEEEGSDETKRICVFIETDPSPPEGPRCRWFIDCTLGGPAETSIFWWGEWHDVGDFDCSLQEELPYSSITTDICDVTGTTATVNPHN